jgi:hypothetical protein
VHVDEAFDFIVEALVALPKRIGPNARSSTHGCDLWIPQLASAYWQKRISNFSYGDLEDERFQVFYDAAWELCRIGVLRPGQFAPRGQAIGGGLFSGDGFSLTAFGQRWLKEASQRPVADPSRLAEVLQTFTPRFGDGYAQRATEAVRTYHTANYLAACVMCGAAAESILLALAIAKSGDEAKILAEYQSSGGRRKVTQRITGVAAKALGAQLDTALHVLHYWRDDASHGTMTTISEIEAYAGLTQLLRLAQFASDHWDQLTA